MVLDTEPYPPLCPGFQSPLKWTPDGHIFSQEFLVIHSVCGHTVSGSFSQGPGCLYAAPECIPAYQHPGPRHLSPGFSDLDSTLPFLVLWEADNCVRLCTISFLSHLSLLLPCRGPHRCLVLIIRLPALSPCPFVFLLNLY